MYHRYTFLAQMSYMFNPSQLKLDSHGDSRFVRFEMDQHHQIQLKRDRGGPKVVKTALGQRHLRQIPPQCFWHENMNVIS